MNTQKALRCLWMALVTYAYTPALILIIVLRFGYYPDFGNGKVTETYLWNFVCIAPGIAMTSAYTISRLYIKSLYNYSLSLLIGWFPYMLLFGALSIFLYKKALYS